MRLIEEERKRLEKTKNDHDNMINQPIGLEYITEYTNPRKVSDHPMYTCSLEGCKSAWGTSDDIFNHCIKPKHHKNFFKKLNPDDTRIAGLSSADVGLTLARRIIR